MLFPDYYTVSSLIWQSIFPVFRHSSLNLGPRLFDTKIPACYNLHDTVPAKLPARTGKEPPVCAYRKEMKALNRILLVEDDCDLAHITEIFLTHAGYTVDIASTCAQAVSLLNQTAYQLVLLDSLLPDGKGNSLCPLIREKDGLCPIIFLSCLDDSNSIISALEHGGDDYMVKPFKHVELLARIQANLRKREAYEAHRKRQEKPHLYEFSTFTIDTDLREVRRDGTVVPLSNIEYDLLLYLVRHPDTLLLYDELYENVWNSSSFGDTRTVMVHISSLRKKIGADRTGVIRTVRGAGYVFHDTQNTEGESL